jgi:hypothetical protein
MLTGKVVVRAQGGVASRVPMAFLEIDFNEHPWLASKRRRAVPYYPLMGSAKNLWRQFDGHKVQVTVTAHATTELAADGELRYTLALEQLPDVSVQVVNESMRGDYHNAYQAR